jgi:TPR repeat protein
MYATGNGCKADMSQARWHLSQAKEKGTSVPPGLEELVFGKGYSCA